MKKVKLLILTMLLVSFAALAQQTEIEKTYDITGKAKRGALANAVYNPTSKSYTLTYITKANDRKVKFQIYNFDHDFNFLKMDQDEMDVDKVKTKYTWFRYRGEIYSVDGIYVEPNLLGTLVLRKKKITYSYDWFYYGYEKKIEVLEKLKPKSDDGTKYFYMAHAEDDVTGDVLILCGIKDVKKGDPVRQLKDMVILRYNHDLDLVSQTPIKFDYPQTLAMTRTYEEQNPEDVDNPGLGGISFVFAPLGVGKYSDPTNTNYTYVRVNAASNKIVERIPFTSPSSYWKIDQMVKDEASDQWYIFGPAAAGKDKYFNALTNTTKFKAVQLMKIHNGKLDYITETSLDEFEKKLVTPPSQKKSPAYDGKKFDVAGYKLGENGDFYVYGQNFKLKDNVHQYNDIIAFHYDNKGVIKAQYGLDTKENNQYSKASGTPQQFIQGLNSNNMYWLVREIKDVTSKGKLLTYPRIGKVNIPNATLSDFTKYGGKNDYYLDPKFPYLETEGNKLVFFGSDKGGKTIWFCRVNLD